MAIDQLLENKGIDAKTQLVGSSADGASVNFGRLAGVLTQYKNQFDWNWL